MPRTRLESGGARLPAHPLRPGSGGATSALRWILCLPIGLSGAWATYVALKFLAGLGASADMLDVNSFVFHLRERTASHAAMGAAFVYLGALVAPAHRRRVAVIFGAAGLLLSGACMVHALSRHDSWAVWAGVCALVGVAGTSYSIHLGRLGIED